MLLLGSNCHRSEARERPEPPGSAPLAARGRYLKPVEALAHLHHPLQACTPLEEQPRAQQRRDATVPCRLSEVSCLLRSTWVARGQTWVERRWDGGASAWTRLSTQEAQQAAQRICSIQLDLRSACTPQLLNHLELVDVPHMCVMCAARDSQRAQRLAAPVMSQLAVAARGAELRAAISCMSCTSCVL